MRGWLCPVRLGCATGGFEEPWVQGLLAFNVAFLAALFLVQAWRASRSSGEDDSLADWVFASGGGGPPFLPSR